jgi:hypothetical protein
LNTLFIFQAHLFGADRSPVVVIKGDRQWIERYIPLEEFPVLFGGYILWREPEERSPDMLGEALGVWSRRKTSKLRRILRERGAIFNVIEGEGPSQALAIRSQHWMSKDDAASNNSFNPSPR